MFTVWCRHAHSDWQSTGTHLFLIAKSYIMLTLIYTIVFDI